MLTKDMPASDVIEVGKKFYIHAESSLAEGRTLSLLHGDTFAAFDRSGDIQPVGLGQQGIFHEDTRYLSQLEMRINGMRPLLLSSSIHEDNILLSVDLTNPDVDLPSGDFLPRGTVHVHRHKFLADGACFERITVRNYTPAAVDVELAFLFTADFADIFEVRGQKRVRRGVHLPEEVQGTYATLAYEGLDNVVRRTRIQCSWPASVIGAQKITVPLHLDPAQELHFTLDIVCESDGKSNQTQEYEETLQRLNLERRLSLPRRLSHIHVERAV